MISVIIPTYKEPEYLDLCLKSIFEGQTNKNEIIVVVDGFLELNKSILDKYPDVKVLDLGTNQGLAVATNWGVYNATSKYILVVNDDNVFPLKWDVVLELYASDWKKGFVLSPNQIEPNPSMFKQFIIENLGKSPEEFDLEKFQKWEIQNKRYEHDYSGSTLPFLIISRIWRCLAVSLAFPVLNSTKTILSCSSSNTTKSIGDPRNRTFLLL